MPAHPDLPRSAGVPAQLANERYVEALARIVYYWGYPAVDTFGRTTMYPGAPMSTTSYLADHMSPAQRWVVSPNNDTFSAAGFANLAEEPAVIQTPTTVPDGHYWTIQIVDVFTNVVHQLGSASATPGGKFLLAGPAYRGTTPEGFHDVLRMPTNVAGVFPRSFAARTPEAKARARAVLNQIGIYPFSANEPCLHSFEIVTISKKVSYPIGTLRPEMVASDLDGGRPQWVNPLTFWDDLQRVLTVNPRVGPADAAMAGQARTLIALRESTPAYRLLLDRVALAAHADLHASSSYLQVGSDAGNGWQRQEDAGVWQEDWFSRAQATVIYVYVNDYREATYFVRGTDAKSAPLDGRHGYTMQFSRDALPPVDRSRGGFWSLTMYDKDSGMLLRSPNGRTNLGTVNLDADELKFAPDGSLTLHLGAYPPADPLAKANWLPAPHGPFSLILRAYVPGREILEGSYTFPNVKRG